MSTIIRTVATTSTFSIPSWVYIIVLVLLLVGATFWYISSVRRGKRENVSIRFELVAYIFALAVGVVGIVLLVIYPLLLA